MDQQNPASAIATADTAATETDPHGPATRAFTPERQVRFLSELSAHGHVRKACAQVAVSPQAAYLLRRRDKGFAAGWDAAMVLALEAAEQVIGEHAVEGYREQVWYRGEIVGERVRFDARLQLAWLARLDARIRSAPARELAGRFDDYLHDLLDRMPDPLTRYYTEAEMVATARAEAQEAISGDLADLDPETVAEIFADPGNNPETLTAEDIVDQACDRAAAAAEAEARQTFHDERRDRLARVDAVITTTPATPAQTPVTPAKAGVAPVLADPVTQAPSAPAAPLEFKSAPDPSGPCQLCQLKPLPVAPAGARISSPPRPSSQSAPGWSRRSGRRRAAPGG